MSFSLTRQPSAITPIAMSFAALGTVLFHIAMFGVAPQSDEGTAAHIWQLLMVGQAPIAAYYAIVWLPRTRRTAVRVLALQACAALAALAPVYFLGW